MSRDIKLKLEIVPGNGSAARILLVRDIHDTPERHDRWYVEISMQLRFQTEAEAQAVFSEIRSAAEAHINQTKSGLGPATVDFHNVASDQE